MQLLVHRTMTLPDGIRYTASSWECEYTVQLEDETKVLAYWGGVGGKGVALGPRQPFEDTHTKCE
ncbi:hypothetical protein GGR57DRAFT_150635 [Xylariaceae sp. FL1272]|nr:hypothetical protein GGR57DRAFT_150635 [Xylariaceae sp. FL1272]